MPQPYSYDSTSHDWDAFMKEQGSTFGQEWNSPPTLTTNAPAKVDAKPLQLNDNRGIYDHNLPYYMKRFTSTRSPKDSTVKTTTTHTTEEHKGKHKINQVVKNDKKNESEHAKKPILDCDPKWPNIKHDSETDKQHATIVILNGTLNKIGEKVEEKVSAIKKFVDSSVDNINKTADGVYQQIGSESSKLIEQINMKLKNVERYLEKLMLGSVRRIDENFNDDGLDDEVRSIANNSPQKPNVVHSDIGKELRSLELLDMDAELRGNLKTSISDAVKKAQDRFNKLIDEQIAQINKKIADITNKFETAFNKFQDVFAKITVPTLKATRPTPPMKVYTPPIYKTTTKAPKHTTQKYTTVHWKPKLTTSIPAYSSKFFDISTTPEYFKFTVPSPKYKQEIFESSDNLLTDLNRMDADVDTLNIVDDAKDVDTVEKGDDIVKMEPVAAIEETEKEEEGSEPFDKLNIEVDTVKSLDDLQSQVLENVKDTLKSDIEDLKSIENNQTEVRDNPEDKLESKKILETAFGDELRNEMEEKELINGDESSNVDNSRAENLDDLAEKVTEIEDEKEKAAVTSQDDSDDSPKLLEIKEDDDVDIKEASFNDEAIDSLFSEQSVNRRKNLEGVDTIDNDMSTVDDADSTFEDEGNE